MPLNSDQMSQLKSTDEMLLCKLHPAPKSSTSHVEVKFLFRMLFLKIIFLFVHELLTFSELLELNSTSTFLSKQINLNAK